jgi:hypothetical protein
MCISLHILPLVKTSVLNVTHITQLAWHVFRPSSEQSEMFSQILCNDFIRASRIYATWEIIIKKLHDTSIRRIPLYIHVMLIMNIFADIISVFHYELTLLTLTS